MMSAHELRRHLLNVHGVNLWGHPWEALIAVHEDDHRVEQDHSHEERT